MKHPAHKNFDCLRDSRARKIARLALILTNVILRLAHTRTNTPNHVYTVVKKSERFLLKSKRICDEHHRLLTDFSHSGWNIFSRKTFFQISKIICKTYVYARR